MKKVKLNNNLHICSITSGRSKPYLCPLDPSIEGTPQSCGSWCAWFDIEDRIIYKHEEGDFLPKVERSGKIVTCKGTPIGELVEEENGE